MLNITASLWGYSTHDSQTFCSFQQKKPLKLKGLKKHKAKVNQCCLMCFLSHEGEKGFCSHGCQIIKTKRMTFSFCFNLYQSKAMNPECEAPPGATSSDYLSEAAKVSLEYSTH